MKRRNRKTTHTVIVPPQFTLEQWQRIVNELGLPPQQANVAALAVQSRLDKEIARELGITEEGVNANLKAIYHRLDIHGRTALAVRVFETAIRLGITIEPARQPEKDG